MKKIMTLALVACLAAPFTYAQNLKPVKDKETKKFGYQDDARNWVIEPAYDKAKKFDMGVGIVTIDKLEGAIDPEGNVLIPVECHNIKVDNRCNMIQAERWFGVDNPDLYLEPEACAWGLYSLDGKEIYAPQFDGKLIFDKEGLAIVTDRATKKQGVVDMEGNVLLPCDYYYVTSVSKGFNALNDEMRVVTFSKDFRTVSDDNLRESAPWMPLAYQTEGDPVRAFAYRHNLIGEKLYRNRIWNAEIKGDIGSRTPVITSPLTDAKGNKVDWGRDNGTFVRLEPVADPDDHTGSFLYNVNDTFYTIQACLYDALGNKLGTISDWGFLYAQANEGFLYMAEGKTAYFIGKDVNWRGESAVFNLTGCKKTDNSSLNSALGVSSSTQNDMRTYWKAQQKHTDVELREKAGYQSYYPFAPADMSSKEAKLLDEIYRKYPFIRRNFRMGQVFGISSAKRNDSEVTVRLMEDLPATYNDDYGHGFKLSATEPVFWGVNGDRFIRIDVTTFKASKTDKEKPLEAHGMIDDVPESELGIRFVFNLFEDDGTFVRTLGYSDKLTLAGHDVFGFEDIGWLFTRMTPALGVIKFREPGPYTGMISYLKNVDF